MLLDLREDTGISPSDWDTRVTLTKDQSPRMNPIARAESRSEDHRQSDENMGSLQLNQTGKGKRANILICSTETTKLKN